MESNFTEVFGERRGATGTPASWTDGRTRPAGWPDPEARDVPVVERYTVELREGPSGTWRAEPSYQRQDAAGNWHEAELRDPHLSTRRLTQDHKLDALHIATKAIRAAAQAPPDATT